MSNSFSLQSEINFSSQGGKKNGTQAIPSTEFSASFPPGIPVPPYVYASYKTEVKLNYLELPVLLKLNLSVTERLSLFINGGPYAGYLLSSNTVTGGFSNIYFDEKLTQPLLLTPVSFDQTTDTQDDIKQWNFGIQAGIGFSLNLGDVSKIMLTVGGNYGLIPIQKDEVNGKNNTGAVTVAIGYLINL